MKAGEPFRFFIVPCILVSAHTRGPVMPAFEVHYVSLKLNDKYYYLAQLLTSHFLQTKILTNAASKDTQVVSLIQSGLSDRRKARLEPVTHGHCRHPLP